MLMVSMVTEDQVINMIQEAGYIPAQRTTQYDILKIYEQEMVDA